MPRIPRRVVRPEEIGASLADARAKGLKYYQPSKPCKRGHLTIRYTLNSSCKDCYRTHRNKATMKGVNWQYRHERDRARIIAEQNALATRPRPFVCEVVECGNGPVVWDHNHATNAFRGWPCVRCNRLFGQVKDRPELLEAQAAYLRNAEASLRPADLFEKYWNLHREAA